MILIDLKYTVAFSEITKHVEAHRDFLGQYYKTGLFLVSGPKASQTGGVIVVNSNDLATVQQIMQEDPFYRLGLAEYTYTVFRAAKFHPDVQHLLPSE